MMKKGKLSRNGSIPKTAAKVLRTDPGSITRIAKRIGVHRSTVSRVLRGMQRSPRVREAIIRECRRMVRSHGVAAVLMMLEERE